MPIPNDGKHLDRIARTTTCEEHQAGETIPCWAIPGGTPGNYVLAVCGPRIAKVGFNGKISPLSLRKTSGARVNTSPSRPRMNWR